MLITVSNKPIPGEKELPLLFWGARYGEMISRLRQAGVAAIGLDYLPYYSAEAGVSELPAEAREKAAELFDRPLQEQLLQGGLVMPSLITIDEQGKVVSYALSKVQIKGPLAESKRVPLSYTRSLGLDVIIVDSTALGLELPGDEDETPAPGSSD